MSTYVSQRAAFRTLHESGCFVVPNPWDIGSAIYLRKLGFKALATTSAGFAFSQGLSDEKLSRDLVLRHVGEIVAATDLPVNADFQAGYGTSPEEVAESVRLCAATGVAGLSVEDATGDSSKPLYELSEALERLAAARDALNGTGVLLTARAECFLVGHPSPLEESLKRLQAYAAAGADVLFAPGLKTREQIRTVVEAVAPKPVNVIALGGMGLSVADMAELGVRRISVGSGLARAAWTGFISAATQIAEQGSFGLMEKATPFNELNAFFSVH